MLDLSHVLTCLNKLDAGIEDKVMLVSRDSQSCLVVSYREVRAARADVFVRRNTKANASSVPTLRQIKKCIEAAYQDLSR